MQQITMAQSEFADLKTPLGLSYVDATRIAVAIIR